MKKIIYFTAGKVPTAGEAAEIAILQTLETPGYLVQVRNTLENPNYGYGIEDCDLVAGTPPTSYNAKTAFGDITANRPALLQVLSAAGAVEVVEAATLQLQTLKVDGTDISDMEITDVTASTDNTAYESDDTDTATVNAEGLVTGVAAGSCTITATHTFDTGKTIAATFDVTVTAA